MICGVCKGTDTSVAGKRGFECLDVCGSLTCDRSTLAAIQGVNPDQIVISDVHRQPAKISWRVTAGEKTYACDSDDLYRLPSCSPQA